MHLHQGNFAASSEIPLPDLSAILLGGFSLQTSVLYRKKNSTTVQGSRGDTALGSCLCEFLCGQASESAIGSLFHTGFTRQTPHGKADDMLLHNFCLSFSTNPTRGIILRFRQSPDRINATRKTKFLASFVSE